MGEEGVFEWKFLKGDRIRGGDEKNEYQGQFRIAAFEFSVEID